MNCKPDKKILDLISKMSKEDIYQAMYCDPLTGVQNRRAFEATSSPAVGIVDMDSLKYINDSYGHRAGDSALIELAEVLIEEFGYGGVYRISGDEFVVVGDDYVSLSKRIAEVQDLYDKFSFGTGITLNHADYRLKRNKSARIAAGRRSERGVAPPWISEYATQSYKAGIVIRHFY